MGNDRYDGIEDTYEYRSTFVTSMTEAFAKHIQEDFGNKVSISVGDIDNPKEGIYTVTLKIEGKIFIENECTPPLYINDIMSSCDGVLIENTESEIKVSFIVRV